MGGPAQAPIFSPGEVVSANGGGPRVRLDARERQPLVHRGEDFEHQACR